MNEAKANNHEAQRKLGDKYFEEKKYEEALKWYEKSVNKENGDAVHTLAVMYMQGMGTPKNMKKAVEYYKRGVQIGIVMSMYNLGIIYLKNKEFLNLKEGYILEKKAAEEGYAAAQYTLGYLYEKGIGTEKDLKKAHDWYIKSSKQGNTNAQYHLSLPIFHRLNHEHFVKEVVEDMHAQNLVQNFNEETFSKALHIADYAISLGATSQANMARFIQIGLSVPKTIEYYIENKEFVVIKKAKTQIQKKELLQKMLKSMKLKEIK